MRHGALHTTLHLSYVHLTLITNDDGHQHLDPPGGQSGPSFLGVSTAPNWTYFEHECAALESRILDLGIRCAMLLLTGHYGPNFTENRVRPELDNGYKRAEQCF